jgi:microcin C transport system substrate-binding protein
MHFCFNYLIDKGTLMVFQYLQSRLSVISASLPLLLKSAFLMAIVPLMVLNLVSAEIVTVTRVATFGEPKYPKDFSHFDYVNPDAFKGGKITLSVIGTYDNFNRYASRGAAVVDSGQLYDAFFVKSEDEIDAYYPLIATEISHDSEFTWMEVTLNPKARFHDGEPITADDAVFSYNKFMTEGVEFFRINHAPIKSYTKLNDHKVRIEATEPSKELMVGLLTLAILPEHYWSDKDFSEPLNEPPLSSGPYKISEYDIGRDVTYERVQDYWAVDLPSRKGLFNFDSIRYDYYRDSNVALEAFKAGEYDFRMENTAKNWAELYVGANFDNNYIIKEGIENDSPQGFSGFVFNTEAEVFRDSKVREALSQLMDFEWMNKTLFYNQYSRSHSFFQNTEYAATELPSEAELEYLKPLKDKIPERVFTEVFTPSVTDGSGRIRAQMRKALGLLKEAGWEARDGKMVNTETGIPLVFEILVYDPTYERVSIPVSRNMKKIGVEMKVRTVDTTQYLKRLRDRDYDMIFSGFSANAYPSPDLKIVWHNKYIDSTYNKAGVKDAAIDSLIEQIEDNQQNPKALKALGPALDRVLQWGHYLIPGWHLAKYRIAYWNKFSKPEITPKFSLGFDSWWYDAEKANKLPEHKRS